MEEESKLPYYAGLNGLPENWL